MQALVSSPMYTHYMYMGVSAPSLHRDSTSSHSWRLSLALCLKSLPWKYKHMYFVHESGQDQGQENEASYA